ncbi:hypothetical protein CPHO_08480 [Corynebacterium phocae]|uniref:Uncharacterized protein n=1 Tax=Corynebacterium phocae TaxID=161895 RepID=A0A1L7D454_9CORY|nr:hypothetical protein [Corynebacterium phocae]APT92914.1 hypothetical protein CPHO_08480 [Corynebacterium phocae]KAA8723243.1 hypothetical protein F4V58_07975 [Corynebacterium phocae]
MEQPKNTPVVPERDLAEKVLLQAAVLKKLYAIHQDHKDAFTRQLEPGDKRTIKNAQGLALGSISKSVPNKKAVCEDPAVLMAMAMEQGVEILDGLPTEGDDRYIEIVDFLIKHQREDLLVPEISPADHKEIADGVLEKWQITGELPAGWKIKEASAPRVTVSPGRTKPVKAAIDHLVKKAGTVLELESGEK